MILNTMYSRIGLASGNKRLKNNEEVHLKWLSENLKNGHYNIKGVFHVQGLSNEAIKIKIKGS